MQKSRKKKLSKIRSVFSEDILRQFDRLLALQEAGGGGHAVKEEGVEELLKSANTPEFLEYERYRKAEKNGFTKEDIQSMEAFVKAMKQMDIPEDEAEKIVYYLREQFSSPLKQTLEEYQKAVSNFFERIVSQGFTRLKFGDKIPHEKTDCVALSQGGSLLLLVHSINPKVTKDMISYMPLPGRKDKNEQWTRTGKILSQETLEKDPNMKHVKNNGKVGYPLHYETHRGIGNISTVEFGAIKEQITEKDITIVGKTFHESMDGLSRLPRTIIGD